MAEGTVDDDRCARGDVDSIRVVSGENFTGTGRGVWLYKGAVLLWGHVFHLEGPLDPADLGRAVMEALQVGGSDG